MQSQNNNSHRHHHPNLIIDNNDAKTIFRSLILLIFKIQTNYQ